MRTNGFALFRGPRARVLAEKAVGRVERYCKEVLVCRVAEVEGWSDATGAEDGFLVAYALEEGRGSPFVHGFLDGGSPDDAEATGEFAMLAWKDGSHVASRDRLGTRPLYIDQAGSCIASDHRFFTETPKLLKSGSSLEIGSMKLQLSGLPESEGCASLEGCGARVAALLEDAVRRRMRGRRKVAVSFSGGLDSSLIALIASKEAEVLLCSAYAADSRDEHQARAAAETLGLELVAVEMDRSSATAELRALDLPFETTPMDRALWCIYSATARLAAAHGAELMLLGQLADELFGGYMKYARAASESDEAAEAMMRADVKASAERAFIRDEQAVARFTEARFPFADERLAAFALAIPVEYKVGGGERKLVLRKAASLLGLPEVLASAPKKAAQYSSGVAKLLT